MSRFIEITSIDGVNGDGSPKKTRRLINIDQILYIDLEPCHANPLFPTHKYLIGTYYIQLTHTCLNVPPEDFKRISAAINA